MKIYERITRYEETKLRFPKQGDKNCAHACTLSPVFTDGQYGSYDMHKICTSCGLLDPPDNGFD